MFRGSPIYACQTCLPSSPLKIRVLSLQTGPRPAADVARADPLRHDAFEPQTAAAPEGGGAVAGERLAELDPVAHRLSSCESWRRAMFPNMGSLQSAALAATDRRP